MSERISRQSMMFREDDIIFCQIQPFKGSHYFPVHEQEQIEKAVYQSASIEILVKHIHYRYNDEGLRYTLIHQLYGLKCSQLQFYVPELVYIAIKKQCKAMRKLLTQKASKNQGIRRLILWNLKAFTVLMKQKDIELKKFVQSFEEELIDSVKDQKQFIEAQKCIAMLTTASLILKTLPKQQQKGKLQRFVKRFNSQYLSNVDHAIIIPFAKEKNQPFESNFVARLVEDDCSCFPTRKRVPYRIFIQTIDPTQLADHKPDDMFFKQKMFQKKDKQNDLFDQVLETVVKMFQDRKKSPYTQINKIKYPFVMDQESEQKIAELIKFASAVKQEQKERQKEKQFLKMKQTTIKRISRRKSVKNQTESDMDYKSRENKVTNEERFGKMYISTLPANERQSVENSNVHETRLNAKKLDQIKKRWSQERQSQGNIKLYEEQKNWNIKTDNNTSVWGQPLQKKILKYKKMSYFHSFKSLKMHNVVVKGGDDLRQQIICMQMIFKIKEILTTKGINVLVKPYQIIVLSENSGLLQFVANSISIDGLKKQMEMDLPEFFRVTFQSEQKYLVAKNNFIRSLVGSSVLTYILRLKDRHNGNILLDCDGNIVHIDFGFILGMSPGGLNFENSPFKLTQEYVELMGGIQSQGYKLFKTLFCDSMTAIRKRSDQLCLILDIMKEDSDLECFHRFEMSNFRNLFRPPLSDDKYRQYCEWLVQKSCMSSRTVNYDIFQWYTNGIEP